MSQPLINLLGIKKHFDMGNHKIRAVDGVDLAVDANEYLAIMGRSGSGKTTLMNIIGCLDMPTEGRYELKGEDVTKLSDDALAHIRNKEIGFVFQTFNLLPRASAFKNVELPLIYAAMNGTQRRELVWEALRAVDLEDRADHQPNELSGGQRQRVAIARALVNKPAIILADEPTGNLDTKSGEEIMDVFRILHEKGNTVIVITHEDHIASFSQRTVRISDGIIASDTGQVVS